jgi:hypothetical protein
MEQMLEALAKARRAQFGDDPRMPNPMRARLHEEIARTGTSEEEKVEESRPSWITMFWPRMTVAAALATLLVLVPAIWWNQSHPIAERSYVAVRDRAAASDQLNPAVPSAGTLANAPAVTPTESTVNLADDNQIKMEPAVGAPSESEASKSSTRVAQGRAATEFPGRPAKDFADQKIAAAKIQEAPVAAPAAGADSKAKSDRMAAAAPPAAQPSSAGNVAMPQQFSQRLAVQSFRNNAHVNREANVLNTFQVQQQGDEIRVLDGDGSTYTGKIEQSTGNAKLDSRITARRDAANQTRAYAAKAARENESAAPQSYFRATGYNVSLKKTLVFEGNYAAPPAQQPATPSNDRARAEQSRDRAHILGIVRVDGEAPVEVDAIAEIPEPAATKKSEK